MSLGVWMPRINSKAMKTAKEILTEKTNYKFDKGEAALIEAMKIYAEQAIDQCAESAKVLYVDLPNEVSKQSILNVKSMLK